MLGSNAARGVGMSALIPYRVPISLTKRSVEACHQTPARSHATAKQTLPDAGTADARPIRHPLTTDGGTVVGWPTTSASPITSRATSPSSPAQASASDSPRPTRRRGRRRTRAEAKLTASGWRRWTRAGASSTTRTVRSAAETVTGTTRSPEGVSSALAGQAVLRARGFAARLAGFLAAASGAWRAVGCRPRAALAASTLASRAAIMSTIFGFSASTAGSSNSSPAALRPIRSRTWTR